MWIKSVIERVLGYTHAAMPTLLTDTGLPWAGIAPTQTTRLPAWAPAAVEQRQTGPGSAPAFRKQMLARLMRCVWTMARGRMFGYKAGAGCPLSTRYLSEPETDSWGVLAMILSVCHTWMKHNSVDSIDQSTLHALAGIISACTKFACGEDMRSIMFGGCEVTVEIQILGVLSGHQLLHWLQAVYVHAKQLQTVLDAHVLAAVRDVPLLWHYAENAQARAERHFFALYRSRDQAEDFGVHALYKALRALPTFYFACMYDSYFLVDQPERHASAMMLAVLASGGYMRTVHTHPGAAVADCREVLAALLRSAPALPMLVVFETGGSCPGDEWATCRRVRTALETLSR